jgi:hypothetical protein
MADTHAYNHTDITRYLQRTMSPQEMHDFEKALMDDPFLADALEGYSNADETVAERHLSEIEWWRIAAIVVVIAFGGLLIFALNGKDEVTNTRLVTSTPAAEIIQKQDTIGPIQNPIAATDRLPQKKAFIKKMPSPPLLDVQQESLPPVLMSQRELSNGY